jgi:hypothetical protein
MYTLLPANRVVIAEATPVDGPSPAPVIEMNSFGAIPPVRNVAALKAPPTEIWGPTGTAEVTVRVTLIACDVTPGPERVTAPINDPALRLVGFTEIESVEGAEPELGATVSQVALDVALQFSKPPPMFTIEALCTFGTVPPTV